MSLLLAAALASSSLTPVMACWDQTFGYNTFRVEKSASRYYVTIKGSQLTGRFSDKEFFVSNGAEFLKIGPEWSSDQHDYHVVFDQSDCALDGAAQKLTCSAGDLMVDSYDQVFWRTRPIDVLGDVQLITSRFAAQRFELTAAKEGFELKKLHRYAGTGEVVSQSLLVTKYVIGDEPMDLDCGDQADSFAPRAAEKLVRHLEP